MNSIIHVARSRRGSSIGSEASRLEVGLDQLLSEDNKKGETKEKKKSKRLSLSRKKSSKAPPPPPKKKYDHRPHEVRR